MPVLPDAQGTRLRLLVSPGSRRNEISAALDGQLSVRVAAPPREGKANRELLAFLADRLDLPRSRLRLVGGAGSRHKTVEIDGLTIEEARARLIP